MNFNAEMIHELLGVTAFLLGLFANSRKNESSLLRIATLSAICWAIAFAVIEAWSATAMIVLIAIRYFIGSFGTNKKWFYLFFTLHLVIGIFTYEIPKDALPVASTLLGTIAVFLVRGAPMRLCFVTASSIWIVHHLVVGSMSGLAAEAIGSSIHLYHLVLLLKNQKDSDEKNSNP